MHGEFDKLREQLNEIKILSHIGALLDWDQQVNLPDKAGEGRSEQVEYIASAVHQKLTAKPLKELAEKCSRSSLSEDQNTVVRELLKTIEKQLKLPATFVAERARVASEVFQLWQSVKPTGDWSKIREKFSCLVEIYRREGDLLSDGKGNPYNALLDIHERDATIEELSPLFLRLADRLSKLALTLKEHGKAPVKSHLNSDAQARVSRTLATAIGYDFSRGALHQAAHPFMTSLGAHDFRITTRFIEDQPLSSVYSTLHEVGHALYEQGLPPEWAGTGRGSAISLGIHESQSRFWENMIGRSRAFMPLLSKTLRAEGLILTEEQIWAESNRVVPSLIRIEADEVTYSLHVVIRLLLESDLIARRIEVDDLPEAWNAAYKKYLGITPASNTEGVLQDVHWYCGLMGYFPTYVLGNLYGAMMLDSMKRQLGDVESLVSSGEFSTILTWLRTNVHQHGMKYGAKQLVEGISKSKFSEEPFLRYLGDKFEVHNF